MKKKLIVLTGPTAVGKTELSISLAKAVNGEIISADSMQVYRHMDIGSAKIMPEEMDGIRHHLIDVLEPWEEFNVTRFQARAREAMEGIYARGHVPIVAGGTGFYIQALAYGIDFTENEASPYRAELEALAEEKGSTWLHEELRIFGRSWSRRQKKKGRNICTGFSGRWIRIRQRRFIPIM